MRGLLLGLALVLAPAFAHADTAALQQALKGLDSLSGEFQQTLVSEYGKALEQSSGRFSLLRPAYLSWHILAPEEQLLVAADDVFWHYDVELEAVTRRRIDPGNPTSPLAILGGDRAVLDDYYEVTETAPGEFSLLPLFSGAEFMAVELTVVDALPSVMRIHDRLGRTTLIELKSLDASPALAPEDFGFEPPAGIDIYSDEP